MAQGMVVIPGKDYSQKIEAIDSTVGRLVINALLTDLKLAVNSSNIDAWCDLLGDTSMIDLTKGASYQAISGKIVTRSLTRTTMITPATTDSPFGMFTTDYTSLVYVGKCNSTYFSRPLYINKVIVKIKKVGNPTDAVYCEVIENSVAGDSPVLGTSQYVNASEISLDYSNVEFVFLTPVPVGGTGTVSAGPYINIKRSGSVSTTNYYSVACGATPAGEIHDYKRLGDGTLYSLQPPHSKLAVAIDCGDPTVIWKRVTASEALEKMAVASSQTLGTGTITWYLSDDGTNWIEVTNLQTLYDTSFDATSIYLKCVLTGNASVEAVAWGGL